MISFIMRSAKRRKTIGSNQTQVQTAIVIPRADTATEGTAATNPGIETMELTTIREETTGSTAIVIGQTIGEVIGTMKGMGIVPATIGTMNTIEAMIGIGITTGDTIR